MAESPAAESPGQPAEQPEQSAPVAAPVAAVVDSVTALATDLTDAVAAEPVTAVLQTPIVSTATTAVDGLLGQVPVASVVDALGPTVEQLPTLPAGDRPAVSAPDPVAVLTASALDLVSIAPNVGASVPPGGAPSPLYAVTGSAAVQTLWGAASASSPDGTPLPGTPNPSTPAAPATSSTSGSSTGGAPGAVASLSDGAWHPLAVTGGTSGPHNDTLPTAPTFESDESPD